MKVVVDPFRLVENANKSASFNSDAFESICYYGLACQVNITNASGLTGSMKLQASNDKVNWIDLNGCCSTDTSSVSFTGNVSEMWHYTSIIAFKWLRLSVTISGGSADFEALITGARV
jgi:hypothetical protein